MERSISVTAVKTTTPARRATQVFFEDSLVTDSDVGKTLEKLTRKGIEWSLVAGCPHTIVVYGLPQWQVKLLLFKYYWECRFTSYL